MDAFTGTSFVILSVSIVGILATSLLLLAYYLFLTRCGLLFFWRPDLQLQLHGDHHHRISVSVTVQDPPRRSGLEEAAIRRIPTFRYRQQLLLAEAGARAGTATATASECAVCLADFRDGERLRLLPPCLHAFHIDCIDAWLQATANCPLCRAAVSDSDGLHYHRLDVQRATDDDIVIDIGTSTPPTAAEAEEAAAAPSNERNCRSSSSSCSSSIFLPMRRSLSMDSCTDKRFYLALQRILQQQNSGEEDGKGESATADSTGRSSRRLRRSFFSFSQSRGSRSAVLPL